MASLVGRKVVGYKVNKSGGGVIKGDVLVPDTSNDNAFTTTTSSAVTTAVWIAEETIANNATGRVLLEGHAELVNVSASVTRGHTATTHTVAKQAVSTGGTSRSAGTFCKFTTGGTTPEADIWPTDLGGASGASTADHFLTWASGDADLSNGRILPELKDGNSAGTPVSMAGAATGTGVTANAETDMAGYIQFTNGSYQYWDVASAVGTGDFDYRCRIADVLIETIQSATTGSAPLLHLMVMDGSRTTTTMLSTRLIPPVHASTATTYNGQVQGGTGQFTLSGANFMTASRLPVILRIRRVGTTITFFCSFNEGRRWVTLGTATSSLNVGKVGLVGHANNTGGWGVLVDWIRSF